MKTEDIAEELQHYLTLYSISEKKEYLNGVLTYAGMLVGRVTK